jgi:hypothetical protein
MFRKKLPLYGAALLLLLAMGGCVRAPAPAELNIPVLPTATAAPTDAATAEMPATETTEEAAAAPAAVTPEPAGETVAHYQGPNSYRATPRFDVAYDTAVWEYVEDDGSGRQSQLKHRNEPGCTIWLRAGPVGATEAATVWLAERAWTLSQVQSHIIQYSAPEGDISWIFGVLLPEEYSGMGNSSCQDAAERVIDTFTIVE